MNVESRTVDISKPYKYEIECRLLQSEPRRFDHVKALQVLEYYHAERRPVANKLMNRGYFEKFRWAPLPIIV